MSFIERMPTGISGLDNMIEGGFPIPSIILVAGDTGTGKTTLCTQFLCKGAGIGERGLCFLTYGGPLDLLLNFASSYEFVNRTFFGTELRYIELDEMLDHSWEEGGSESILKEFEVQISNFKPARIVIEGLSILEDALKEDYWRFLLRLSHLLKIKRVVAVLAEDSLPGFLYPPRIAEVADGIILLKNEEINLTRRRSIEILKMCGTSHHLGKHAVDISPKGMMIYPGL